MPRNASLRPKNTESSAYAKAGSHDAAEAVYAELLARARAEYVQSFWLAMTAGVLGRIEEGMA